MRTIRIIEVIRDGQEIGAVTLGIFHHAGFRNHGGVKDIHALVLIPVDQVIAVNQGTHVDIRCVVAKHLRKEIAAHFGGMTDNQFFGIFDGIFLRFRRFRLRCQGQRGQQERQGQQQGQHAFFHHQSSFPILRRDTFGKYQSKVSPTWLISTPLPKGVS